MKRITLIFISSILLVSTFLSAVSCQSAGGTAETTTEGNENETTERLWIDSLEDKNFEGAKFLVLTLQSDDFDSSVIGEAKEVISAAKLRKIQNVETRFNVEIRVPVLNFEQSHYYTKNCIRDTVDSDTYMFDYVNGNGLLMTPIAMEGYMVDMAKLEEFDNIDLTQPWWCKSYTDALNVGDMYYWLTGYSTTCMTHMMYSVFVNTEMCRILLNDGDGSAENQKTIYDVVRNREWTLDRLAEMSRSAYKDDGDGSVGANDRMGFAMSLGEIDKLAVCAGATYTKRDENNIPFGDLESERNVKICEKLYDLIHDDSYTDNGMMVAFSGGNCLFYCENLYNTISLREVEWDFGVIPLPLFDENQEEYLNTCHYSTLADGITVTVPAERYDMILTLSEALAAETYRICRPAELDEALKNKYSRDEDTKEMIDLTQKNITTDFLIVYGNASGYDKLFQIASDTRDISSSLARKKKSVNKLIEGYVDKFEDCSER